MLNFNIRDFFKRIQNIHAKEILIRSLIKDVIKKHTNHEIPIESIKFSSGNIVLKGVNQSLRSVIFIKRTNIIQEINASQQIKRFYDIK